MKTTVTSLLLALSLLAAGVAGCGDSPFSKPVSDMTDDELKALCERALDAAGTGQSLRAACMAGAKTVAALAGDPSQCQPAYDKCVKEGQTAVPDSGIECDTGEIKKAFQGCKATGTELLRCTEDSAAALAKAMQGITCDPSSKLPQGKLPMPQSCLDLAQRCPGFATIFGD